VRLTNLYDLAILILLLNGRLMGDQSFYKLNKKSKIKVQDNGIDAAGLFVL